MALSILGEDGGKFAVLSASPDAANQNAWIAALEEVLQKPEYASLGLPDIVYGNDQSEDSYNLGAYALGGLHFLSPEVAARIHTRPDEQYRRQEWGGR